MSKRFTFTFTEEQVTELVTRAKANNCIGETDRELIYLYFCQREELEPVRHGGRREEAISATRKYHRAKSKKKVEKGKR